MFWHFPGQAVIGAAHRVPCLLLFWVAILEGHSLLGWFRPSTPIPLQGTRLRGGGPGTFTQTHVNEPSLLSESTGAFPDGQVRSCSITVQFSGKTVYLATQKSPCATLKPLFNHCAYHLTVQMNHKNLCSCHHLCSGETWNSLCPARRGESVWPGDNRVKPASTQ